MNFHAVWQVSIELDQKELAVKINLNQEWIWFALEGNRCLP